MNPIFGQDGQRVLALITGIADLTAEEVDQVTDAWKQACPVGPRHGLGSAGSDHDGAGTVPDSGGSVPGAPRGPGEPPIGCAGWTGRSGLP